MAEQSHPVHPSAPACSFRHRIAHRIRSFTIELHRLLGQFTTLAFVGGSAVLGVDSFNLLIAFWPLYPTAVPLIVIGCAVLFGLVRIARSAPTDPALSFRPSRRGLERRLR